MDEEPKYASSMRPNVERGIALALVILWAVSAYLIGGLPLAMRAVFLFSFPLAFIWLPELMARIPASKRSEGFRLDYGVLPIVMRCVGWTLLLGVPAGYAFFWWSR